jgi:4-carboxymuconolactone decarboxylase
MAVTKPANRYSDDPSDWRYPQYWKKEGLWERGSAVRAQVGDLALVEDLQELAQFDPLLPHYLVQFFYGEILSRPHLTQRTRMLVALAALAASGDEEGTEAAVEAALNVGATREQIVEVIVQNAAYGGFRLWIKAAKAGLRVFRRRGIAPPADAASAWRDPAYWQTADLWDKGWARRDEMWGAGRPSSSGEWATLDPLFPHYVNEFRFGELLSRPGLDLKTQHLCSVAAFLAVNSEGGAEGSIYGALDAGATQGELADVVFLTGTLCGYAKWTYGGRATLKVLRMRGQLPPQDPAMAGTSAGQR